MTNDLDEFLQNVSDNCLYEMLVSIFNRLFPPDSIFLPILQFARKHGMPVKNIVPFITDLGEWCKANQNVSNNNTLSDEERQSLSDLLSRSGFMTIGFDKDGDLDGNG